jgi:hypothetical protein
MTDPVRRDATARPIGSKVAFVVIAAVLWTAIIVLDNFIQSHETPAVALYIWQPGSLFRLNPALETVRNLITYGFMLCVPILYRYRYAGVAWVRDAFAAMVAIYAVGFCMLAPIYRSSHHAFWSISWLGLGVVVCVLCGIFSVFWAWIFTAGVVRLTPRPPPAR